MEQWPQSQSGGWMTESRWPRGGEETRPASGWAQGEAPVCQPQLRASPSTMPAGASLVGEALLHVREACAPGMPAWLACAAWQGGGGGEAEAGVRMQKRRGPPHPLPAEGPVTRQRVSHPLIGAGVWRGCRRREIGLGQGCLHWPALPPSFTPPQRPLSPLIPCGLPLPACLPAATPAASLCPGHRTRRAPTGCPA